MRIQENHRNVLPYPRKYVQSKYSSAMAIHKTTPTRQSYTPGLQATRICIWEECIQDRHQKFCPAQTSEAWIRSTSVHVYKQHCMRGRALDKSVANAVAAFWTKSREHGMFCIMFKHVAIAERPEVRCACPNVSARYQCQVELQMTLKIEESSCIYKPATNTRITEVTYNVYAIYVYMIILEQRQHRHTMRESIGIELLSCMPPSGYKQGSEADTME